VPESEPSEQPEQRSASALPSGLIAFMIAVLAAVAFVVNGYYAMRREPTCDGGTCVVAFYVGMAQAVAALVVGFPTLWLLISVGRRLVRRLRLFRRLPRPGAR
jgi:hypothetical protein